MTVLGTQLLNLNVFTYSTIQNSPNMHCAYTRTHIPAHPFAAVPASLGSLLIKTFLCKRSQLIDLSQRCSPGPSPHHTLPSWRSSWKVLLGLGCRPHVHMGLNKQASVVCGFIIEFPQEWRDVGAELPELRGEKRVRAGEGGGSPRGERS